MAESTADTALWANRPPNSHARWTSHGPNHNKRVYEDIQQLLPDENNPTPLVKLNHVTGFKHAVLYGKLEWFNPWGSVKDRVGANLVMDAEEKGYINQGTKQLVEPTSGNTGLGLVMMANTRRLPLTVPISTRVPAEKRNALKLMGAKLIELDDELCPKPGAREGAIATAEILAKRDGWYGPNQYKNTANPDAHFRTTGPEIWKQTEGKVTHFFSSLGTCGTISGTGRFLKTVSQGKVKVHGVHPTSVHDIPGVRSLPQLKMTDHYKPEGYDELVEVTNEDAFNMCIRLNQEESLIAGPSSGMNIVGAMRLMEDKPGNVGVVICCDDVFKYTASAEKHCPHVFGEAPPGSKFEPAELKALESIIGCMGDSPDTLGKSDLVVLGPQLLSNSGNCPRIIDVRPADEFNSRLRPLGAVNIPLAELSGGEDSSEVVQVFDVAGAVQRKAPGQGGDERPKKRPRTAVMEALKKVFGEVVLDMPLILVCNRGVDSTFGLLTLKAASFTSGKHVGRGMFAWREFGLPTEPGEKLVDMPPAKDEEEETLLKNLGYKADGKPISKDCKSCSK